MKVTNTIKTGIWADFLMESIVNYVNSKKSRENKFKIKIRMLNWNLKVDKTIFVHQQSNSRNPDSHLRSKEGATQVLMWSLYAPKIHVRSEKNFDTFCSASNRLDPVSCLPNHKELSKQLGPTGARWILGHYRTF